jgi:hypothetical protein
MAHDPQRNPTKIGGRQARFVVGVVAHRKFNADRTAERNLVTLGGFLAGQRIEDKPSVSSILRRALEVYTDHVRAISGDPHYLEREKAAVRAGSKLPTIRKNKEGSACQHPSGNV